MGERFNMQFTATMDSAIAGMGNRSVATDEVVRSWAEAVRSGEQLTEDELKRYYHGYARVAYPAHFLNAEKPERTSIHLRRDISDDVKVIGEMIERIDPTLKDLKANRTGKYNRQLIITLALLRQAEIKSGLAKGEDAGAAFDDKNA